MLSDHSICIFNSSEISIHVGEPWQALTCHTEVQDIPGNLIAAGYIALCDFFQGKAAAGSGSDPRMNAEYIQGKQLKKTKFKKPEPKKRIIGEDGAEQPRSKKKKYYQDGGLNVIHILSDDEHDEHVGASNVSESNGDAPLLEPPVPVVNEMVPEPVAPAYLNFDLSKFVFRNRNEHWCIWV